MTRLTQLALLAALILWMAGCSESPQATKAPELEKPAEPVSALEAYYQLFPMARAWAPDLELLQMADIRVPDIKPVPGKAAAWQAVFVSPSKRRARRFVYSVVKTEDLAKGVSPSSEESYTPRGQARPFRIAAFKIDSVDAYKTALQRSAEYVKKNPEKPVTFLLESTPEFPNPAWRVIWGDSVLVSNYSVYVDATTGGYLRTMR